MVWFVCKMRLQHMYAFVSENLTVNQVSDKHMATYQLASVSTGAIQLQ